MSIKIEPLQAPLGACVLGLDSRKTPSDADFQKVAHALYEHVAIVAPDLEENVTWLRDFTCRFGPLVPHVLDQYHHPDTHEISIIARNTGTAESRDTEKPAGAFWHSDLSYEAYPADALFLYATEVPSHGGDTLAANMYLAYDSLPEKTRIRIDDLTATHRWGWNGGTATVTLTDAQRASHPDVVHPVVRRHPVTGRKALFASPGTLMKINELDQAEGDDLLQELFAQALNPEFQYRHCWSKDMLLGLDNRVAIHAAVDDYTEPRRMLRMLVGCSESTH